MNNKRTLIIFAFSNITLGLLIYLIVNSKIDILSGTFFSGLIVAISGYYLSYYFYKHRTPQ